MIFMPSNVRWPSSFCLKASTVLLGSVFCIVTLNGCIATSRGGDSSYVDPCTNDPTLPGCLGYEPDPTPYPTSDPFDPGFGDTEFNLGRASASNEDSDSKDLISVVADRDQKILEKAGKEYAQKYALSEDVGLHIAKTLTDFSTLTNRLKRARTQQDIEDFSMRLYGMPLKKAETAVARAVNGDTSGLEEANGDVATFWGTTPETSKVILKRWYKDQLSVVGVK